MWQWKSSNQFDNTFVTVINFTRLLLLSISKFSVQFMINVINISCVINFVLSRSFVFKVGAKYFTSSLSLSLESALFRFTPLFLAASAFNLEADSPLMDFLSRSCANLSPDKAALSSPSFSLIDFEIFYYFLV